MSSQIIHWNHPWSIVAICMWIFPVCDIPLQVCIHAIRPALAIIGEHFPHSLALTSFVLRSGRKIKLLFFPFPHRTHAGVSMAASHLHSGTGQHFSPDPLVHSCLLLVSVLSSAVRQTTFLPGLKSSMMLCLSSLSLVGLVYYVVVHMSIVWRWLGNGFITSEADPSLCVPHERCSPLGA